jgi:hypothetical protein
VSVTEDRTGLWVPLLRRLTGLSPQASVRGNVEGGLAGTGDIDLVAPEEDWPRLEREFVAWATEHGVGPVIACSHVFDGLILVAVGPPGSVFFELEIRGSRYFRGARLFGAADLLPAAEMDPRGFRALAPGAEGLLMLVLNGLGRVGRPWPRKLKAKNVPAALRADPAGMREAARLFGWAERAVLRGAAAVTEGGWDRRSMLTVESWALWRAAAAPQTLVRRMRFRASTERCIVARTITEHDRRISTDQAEWLRSAAPTHRIYRDGPTGA